MLHKSKPNTLYSICISMWSSFWKGYGRLDWHSYQSVATGNASGDVFLSCSVGQTSKDNTTELRCEQSLSLVYLWHCGSNRGLCGLSFRGSEGFLIFTPGSLRCDVHSLLKDSLIGHSLSPTEATGHCSFIMLWTWMWWKPFSLDVQLLWPLLWCLNYKTIHLLTEQCIRFQSVNALKKKITLVNLYHTLLGVWNFTDNIWEMFWFKKKIELGLGLSR